MFQIKLPFWLDKAGSEINKIRNLFEKWWTLTYGYFAFLFKIIDEENCSEQVLNLIAYQRDITRFEDEPLELFRKRVKYALINAKEAGSKQGFANIFVRLGIGYIEQDERFDEINWDVIRIHLTDKQLAGNSKLIENIIRHYGRTCRRYEFAVINSEEIVINFGEFNHEYQWYSAKVDI